MPQIYDMGPTTLLPLRRKGSMYIVRFFIAHFLHIAKANKKGNVAASDAGHNS